MRKEWIRGIVSTKGIHLAVDGKALRAAMEKVKGFRAPMVLNAVDAATGLVVAQMPIKNKDCEIKAIPELLKLLDIKGSIVTTDAVGTQTQIMGQILSQKGHFVLMVKKNQPQSYEEILKYFGEMSDDHKKMEKDRNYRPRHPEMQEKYEETSPKERNRDRQEYRWYSVCTSMQPSDKDTERMAVCKNSGTGQPDTDTGRKGCAGERHHVGYKNFSGKRFQKEAETCSGRRNRKRYPENENRNDFRHGTDGGRNRPDKKGALGS